MAGKTDNSLLLFQHTAARRRLVNSNGFNWLGAMFQHTAARRRLVTVADVSVTDLTVSTHSRPKAAGYSRRQNHGKHTVSTHSRPKAAGQKATAVGASAMSFNTQPPEGGWQITRRD